MNKICYVVTIPLTIKTFFIPQLKYLAEHGFDVSVICAPDKDLQGDLGNSVRYIPVEIPRGFSIGGSAKAIRALKRIFQREQFDFIQYSTPNAALYASIAAKTVGCKVRNYHLMGFRYLGASGVGSLVLKTIEKISCWNSTSIECVSKSNLEIGVNEGIFKREKAIVVWNGSSGGVDLKRFDYKKRKEYRAEIREKYGISQNDFVYGFVGRITRDKGVNEMLEAFKRINNAKLMIVGDPEGVDTLDQILYRESLENDRIIYTGNVTDPERYFASIDVLLLPSYREGFGNVVIEAAAMGTPAIVSNIPGPIDAIDKDKTALVVPVKDSNVLTSAMEKMQKNDLNKMSKDAYEYVRTYFDGEKLCEKILERKEKLLR